MLAQENEDQASQPERAAALSLEGLWCHLVWLAAAIAAGVVAFGFAWIEDRSEDFQRWTASQTIWLQPLLLAAGMVVICRLRDLAFPSTPGTGIPQAIAALKMGEGPERSLLLSGSTAVGKSLLLTLGMFCG